MTLTSKVMYSSVSNEWTTPQWLFKILDKEFHFTLDPCCTEQSAKCSKFFTEKEDGLKQSWDGEIVFMNPPYGRSIKDWIKKAATSNALTVALIPARVDTGWWWEYIQNKAEVRFLKGRIKFGESTINAPFPSCIVIFDNRDND